MKRPRPNAYLPHRGHELNGHDHAPRKGASLIMNTADQNLERIRKLLTKAERAATPDEASAYNAKAAELMAKHGVDAVMLAATAPNGTRDVISSRDIPLTDPYTAEKASLMHGISRAMGCRAISIVGPGRGHTYGVTVIGFESDLPRVELLYTSLLLQATKAVVQQRPPAWSGESVAAFRRTWLLGFSTMVSTRLAAAFRSATQAHDAGSTGGPSATLVLADRRTRVDRAVEDRFTNLSKGSPRRLSGSGYVAGAEAGRRADIGNTALKRSRPELGQ
ncbi:DUF2786 domain-containing protein [Pseudonocardia sp. GCM10023141]|uniref:DUF2786 domain-containing protein n=1 Tax=Pseudonocardia sp. GCM10023141 TaxID=3252653 RepID=UPI00361BB5EE